MERFDYLKVCSKKATTKDGRSFDAYFGYLKFKEKDGTYSDMQTKNGKAPSFRVVLSGERLKHLAIEGKFPYMLTLDPNGTDKREPDYYLVLDKDKETKKPKLDKNGNRHFVFILNDYREAVHVEPKGFTLEDLLEDEE